MSDIFFRAYVGPKFERSSAGTHFNWAAAGLTDNAAESTTLAATLASGVTTATLASTAYLTTTGGVWIAGNGTGQAWEYVGYTGKSGATLTGLVRESTTYREHNGVHTSGAVVRQWIPIDTDAGTLRIGRELNDELCATTWYAEMAGVRFPQHALRNEHVIVVQTATRPGGTWTDLLVGFVDSPSVTDTWEKRAEWRVRILSIAGMMGYTQARGVRVGEWDIAREATATSSPVIPGAHKEYETANFDPTLRSFEAANALDGRTDTLWVADEMIGTPNPAGLYTGVSQMYINPTPSLGRKGYRWLQIEGADMRTVQLWAYSPTLDLVYTSEQLGVLASSGEIIVVCESEALFRRENPSQHADYIVDLSETDQPYLFDFMEPAGGAIAYRAGGITSQVKLWGTQTNVPSAFNGGSWSGGPIDAPGKDQTMRRLHSAPGATTEATYWEVSRRQAPGHPIENNDDQVWIQVNLPGMALELHADITNSVTTITCAWGDTPSTDGLPDSGTILIDDEEISYTGKTSSTLTGCTRGANSSTAAAHKAHGKIYLMYDIAAGTSYSGADGYPLKSTSWYDDAGGVSVIERTLLWSAIPNMRTPDDSLHEADYPLTLFNNVAATSQTVSHSPLIQPRTLLMQFETLSADPARPRLSRIVCLVDPARWDSDYWVSTGTVLDALTALAENAGVPAAAITTGAGGFELDSHITASDMTWAVMTDLADYSGAYIDVGLDSHLTHSTNALWTTAVGGYSADRTWAATDVVRIEKVWRRGQAVSQVKMDWLTPGGIEQESVVYPATNDGIGRTDEIGPYLYANSTAATLAARKRYFQARYPYTALVQLATGDLSIEPGELHQVTWQFAQDMQPIERLYLVKAVDHQVENGALITTLNLVEIDREAA